MSDLERNKSIACRWLELINAGDLAALVADTPPDWRLHGGPPGLPGGPAGVRELFAHMGNVRQKWTVDDVIAERDKVAIRATNNCEQDAFLGIPAADVTQVFTATLIFRISGGQVHEIWRNADDLGRLRQLGVQIRPPAPASAADVGA